MSTFIPFAKAVNGNLKKADQNEYPLLVADISGDELYELYLSSFPEGTNNIFRERTEHDCSCCKDFIRNLGRIQIVTETGVDSIWNISEELPYPYNIVANAMHEAIINSSNDGALSLLMPKYGAETTVEYREDQDPINWNHFYGESPLLFVTDGETTGKRNQLYSTIKRSFEEITDYAVDTVIDLISDGNLYRGEEFKAPINNFKQKRSDYFGLNDTAKNEFLWTLAINQDHNAAIRNTVIGTLLVDLSSGVELEQAVASFESKIAPTNYKRPKALVTPAMMKAALKTIQDKDLEPSLYRRLANIKDVAIQDVLWAGEEMVAGRLTSLSELAMASVSTKKPSGTKISVEDFLRDKAPKSSSIRLWFDSSLANNLMTVTAPKSDESANIFKWGNKFGWSYNGNITDAIKERVKGAGGNINADLRFSLSWFNYDDLDLHMETPTGTHVYYGNRLRILDVDMNAGSRQSREPVENMAIDKPVDGTYDVWVHNFSKRENDNVGFVLQVEDKNGTTDYVYDFDVRNNERVNFKFEIKNGIIVNVVAPAKATVNSQIATHWGIDTNQFVNVRTIMNSPNHWSGEQEGLKHTFFILQDCKADTEMRGFYNEFLANEFSEHRKAFELLGNLTKCEMVDDQLSGVGLTSNSDKTLLVETKTGNRVDYFELTF